MENYLTEARLIALSAGQSKSGKSWYKAVFKRHLPDGTPVVSEFWLSERIGNKMKRLGLLEDCDVLIACGFDDFFRFQITDILPLEGVKDDEVIDLD